MYSVHSLHECQDHRTVLIEQVVTALQLDFSVQIWEGALGSITQENVAVRSILIKQCSYASGRAKPVRLLLQNDKVTFPDHPEETG